MDRHRPRSLPLYVYTPTRVSHNIENIYRTGEYVHVV
jgi:hypothetical protein